MSMCVYPIMIFGVSTNDVDIKKEYWMPRNTEKSKLFCLLPIKVVKSHNCLLNNKKETPYHWSFIMIYG